MSNVPNRASQPAGKSRRKGVTLDLSTARQMLPLVKSIVADIVETKRALTRLSPERDLLDDNRRALSWTSRRRRYSLHEEMGQAEQNLATAVTELDALGVSLVDDGTGQVDFPTRINGRAAAFSWRLGEDEVGYWRFAGERQRRPLPSDWQPGSPIRLHAEA